MKVWYDYAILRVVPRVERGEFVNVGIVLFARERDYLAVRIAARWEPVRAMAPDVDVEAVAAALAAIERIVAADGAGGPIAQLPTPERFHWLTAPRSTVVQSSPVHTGQCESPAAALDDLFADLVLTQ